MIDFVSILLLMAAAVVLFAVGIVILMECRYRGLPSGITGDINPETRKISSVTNAPEQDDATPAPAIEKKTWMPPEYAGWYRSYQTFQEKKHV